MKTILVVIASISYISSFSQTIQQSVSDSLCNHPIVKDSEGKLLSWYEPDISGAGYNHVIHLASDFILNIPKEPTTGREMYHVLCCFEGPGLHNVGEEGAPNGIMPVHWLNNPACINAGAVHSFADKYYYYTGREEFVDMVGRMLDYQIAFGSTPSDWVWADVPYASANGLDTIYAGGSSDEFKEHEGDGLHVIEPDKVGELGYAYARYYMITEEQEYLEAALDCADALIKNHRDIPLTSSPENREIAGTQSPWPFRVNALTGDIISEYTSNVTEPLKLLNLLIQYEDTFLIDTARAEQYKRIYRNVMDWLYSVNGPMKTYIWSQYFEDIPNDDYRISRNQVTPAEWAKHLMTEPELDARYKVHVPTILYWILNTFGDPDLPAIREQTWCYDPMGSHSARYGSACAMWYEISGNEWFKNQAFQTLNYATYMTWENGVVSVGHTWPGSWFSDGYTDYVRHFIDAMAAIPEWAPDNENHLLRTSSVIQYIDYDQNAITYKTFDEQGIEKFRLISEPKKITIDGKKLEKGNYTWEALHTGGVLEIIKRNGKYIKISL